MPNGQEPRVPEIIKPPKDGQIVDLVCHRFYAPVVFPEPDKLDPRKANITPRLGNFPCCRDKCTLWNVDAKECRDVTDSKSRAIMAEYAFAKLNDVHIAEGGS